MKILKTDTMEDVFVKMAEGNIGAVRVLSEIFNIKDGIKHILHLDSIGLYGSKLYMLWNDCCDRDINKVLKIIYSVNIDDIHSHLSGGRGTPFDIVD